MDLNIDISKLSAAECIILAEKLWDHAASHPTAVPVGTPQLKELRRRLDAFEQGELPPGQTWETVDDWLSKL